MNDFEDKRSETERILERALNDIGLYPIPQYQISRMHVDFAFPEERLVVEVDGKHHDEPEQSETDAHRDDYLIRNGWTVFRLHASGTYHDPERTASLVKERLESRIEKSYERPHSPYYEPKIPKSEPVKYEDSFWDRLEKITILSFILLCIYIYITAGGFGLMQTIFLYTMVLFLISHITSGELGLRRTMFVSIFVTLFLLFSMSNTLFKLS